MVVALESDLGLCCGSGGETALVGMGLGLIMALVWVPGRRRGGDAAADMLTHGPPKSSSGTWAHGSSAWAAACSSSWTISGAWVGSIENWKNCCGGGGGVWLRALTGGDGNLGERGGVLGDMGGVLGDSGGMWRSVLIGGTRGERSNVIFPDSQVFSYIRALFLCPIATSTLTSALIWTA